MCVQLEMIRQMMDAETKKLDKCAVLVQSFWRGLQERRVIQVRAVIRGACTSRRHTPQHLFLPCASCSCARPFTVRATTVVGGSGFSRNAPRIAAGRGSFSSMDGEPTARCEGKNCGGETDLRRACLAGRDGQNEVQDQACP